MIRIMTPLQLSVLLHYYVSPGRFELWSDPVEDAISMHMDNGLMNDPEGALGIVTEKGKFYIEHILCIPYPVERFEIPQ